MSTTVKERPILFTPQMAAKVADGSKTQTRRLTGLDAINADPDGWELLGQADGVFDFYNRTLDRHEYVRYQYGPPGRRLVVREALKFKSNRLVYMGDGELVDEDRIPNGYTTRRSYFPNIFMPRWACRSEPIVAREWFERVEDISEADAKAEGFASDIGAPVDGTSAGERFLDTFYRINKRAPAGKNPWVRAVQFSRETEAA